MNRTDPVRYSDDFGAPHPGRLDQDAALKERIQAMRADAPKADAAEIGRRIRADLKRRGQAAPVGLDRLVAHMLR